MAREIERKFLVRGDGWRQNVVRETVIRQGYLASTGKLSMRVRIRDEAATLTIKSAAKELDRAEFEYAIPVADARELLALAGAGTVEKRRHDVVVDALRWEVDVFAGRHEGLVLAEIELEAEGGDLALPDWAGEEVTGDPRFYNETLATG